MARSRNKVPAKARHKKILKAAKGYRGARSKQFRTTTAAVWNAGQYAAVREHDENMTYSRFIGGLGKAGIEMDRKVMSDLAIKEPAAFGALVEKAKAALA